MKSKHKLNNKKLAIGIDLGGQSIKGALVNSKGKIIYELVEPTESEKGIRYVMRKIIKMITSLSKYGKYKNGEILGACVATPGLVDIKNWVVRIAPNLHGWVNIPLRKQLQKSIKLPVYIENDANAAAYGEKWVGAGKNRDTMVVLTVGTGIGGGIILDGKLWHGADGAGGEPGHINLFPNGFICGCRNYGCLEAYASSTGIVKRTKMALNAGDKSIIRRLVKNDLDKISPKVVYQAAVKGDKLARQILEETGRYLGIGIMSLVNLLNPEMIILGGGVMEAGNYILKPALEEFNKRGFKFLVNRTEIVKAQLGSDAGRIGAAGIVFANHRTS